MLYNPKIKKKLEYYHDKYNSRDFIEGDPISIPHRFSKRQDIEIAGFLTSVIAWGRRSMIINNASRLMELMDNSPYDFIVKHQEHDRKKFMDFKHRTFQVTDTLYFLELLQWYYQTNDTLESAFLSGKSIDGFDMKLSLEGFHDLFFSLESAPHRTKKHIPTPVRKSTCKRLNMFLRWMVRSDDKGVDFGLWKNISPADLMIPIDVHVERYARKFGLLERKQRDWSAVEELTANLRLYDKDDPVKYDFALFGIGVMEGEDIDFL
ncbi:MAG: TIGR02757 family protein [Saprospiraceae bacterium]|nr:TIGR02757 family protein [Saprospiraceae bacterium]